jgi:capsule polysaccharide export protein KpsE/RkpR
MVTNVTSLLKTVKAVEDEHSRGTRALEATIEAIGQEIRVCNILELCKSTQVSYFLLAFARLCSLTSNLAQKPLLRTLSVVPSPSLKQLPRLLLLAIVANRTISL